MDNDNVAANPAPMAPPGMPFFEHGHALAVLFDECDFDCGEIIDSLLAHGWDLAVEQAAQRALERGVDTTTLARITIKETRRALRRTGRIDELDLALLLLAEIRLTGEHVETTPENEVGCNLGSEHLCTLSAIYMAHHMARGEKETRLFLLSLRQLVQNIANKAAGLPNPDEQGRVFVRDLAQQLITAFDAEVQS